MKIGIAVLAYNRPKHLSKVIDAIIREKIKNINVYIDGPKNNQIRLNQLKIANLLNKYKNLLNITIIKQNINHGLAYSVTNAVSSELKKNDAVIVLEDDCVPRKNFFRYMIKSLNKFKANKKVRSICSYYNLENKLDKAFFLERFNPWGWATWKDRWKDYEHNIRKTIKDLKDQNIINRLPQDLKSYCNNEKIIQGKEDIWSLSWTMTHYLKNSLILYPPKSIIDNIGFDGTGVHCVKTKVFKTKPLKQYNIKLPNKVILNIKNNISYNQFLIGNSAKTFFKKEKIDLVEPYKFIKKNNYILAEQIRFYLEKFTYECEIIDIHTHLYPSKFKKFHRIGIIDLLNYHYLIAEFLSLNIITPSKFFNLGKFDKAKLIWNNLFLKRYPYSTATVGVLRVINAYGIYDVQKSFKEILKMSENHLLSENDIFEISRVKKVVMTNNPFIPEEFNVLTKNLDRRYIPSIRIDDIFENNPATSNSKVFKADNEKGIKNLMNFFEKIIQDCNPAYFALSSENLEEFKKKEFFEKFFKLLSKYKLPLMLLVGVKRGINTNYQEAGDGVGSFDLKNLEAIINKYHNNNFLVTCLNLNDQFKLNVTARKFQNLKIFGFWWFNNNKSIVNSLFQQRLELLGDNFVFQHSDARVLDQLIYKWIDFKNIYVDVMAKKYNDLIRLGFKIDPGQLQKKTNFHFCDMQKKILNL